MPRFLKEEEFKGLIDNTGKKRDIKVQFYESLRGHVLYVAFDEKGEAVDAGKARSKVEALNTIRDMLSKPDEDDKWTKHKMRHAEPDYNQQNRGYDESMYGGRPM